MGSSEGFSAWLSRHGLESYADALISQDIDSVGVLLELTDDDFDRIGIKIGGKRRLLGAARNDQAPEGDRERRQLSIMFCDLVGSTAISTTMDPEDLADLLNQYTAACRKAVRSFDGHIAKYLGDGVLAYFGYPFAHEDDAVRAIHAARDIIDRVAALNRQREEALAVRIGIATGLVVVGDVISEGGGQRDEVVGETPNLAARVQGVAGPGEVVVAESTRRLADGSFVFHGLGPFELKGIAEPQDLFRVDGELGSRSRFEARHEPGSLSPLIGRERELELLEPAQRLARTSGRSVLVTLEGDAGIGKSRLAYEYLERHAIDPRVIQCSELHQASPFQPIVAHLRRRLELHDTVDRPDEAIDRIEARLDDEPAVAEVADLLGVADQTVPGDRPPAQRRALLIEAMSTMVRYRPPGDGPLVVMIEDLHWADASTIEWIGRLLLSEPPLVVVATHRPDFEPPWPVDADRRIRVRLGPLERDAAQQLFATIAGDDRLGAALTERSGGIPLYVEELARSLTSAPASEGAPVVPQSLQDSLMAQLDGLGSSKSLAQAAAVIGREFTSEFVGRVAGLAAPDVEARLAPLLSARVVVADHDVLVFRHALIQDVAYGSLVRGDRLRLHRRVAELLDADDALEARSRPEVLAHHCQHGGLTERAARAWIEAGELAARRGASVEAITHLNAARESLESLEPSSGRDELELRLQLQRGGMLKVTEGFGAPSTGAAFDRAAELARSLGDDVSLAPALLGQYAYWLQHDYLPAGDAAHELLALAERNQLEAEAMIGHRTVGIVDYHVGAIGPGVEHLRQALAAYDEDRHADLRHLHGTDHAATTACFLGMALVLRGDVSEGVDLARWSVDYANHLEHGPSVAQTLTYLGFVGTILRDPELIAEATPRLLSIARRISFPLMLASGEFWQHAGASFARPSLDTVHAMVDADERWMATGNFGYASYRSRVLADAAVRCGAIAESSARLAVADDLVARSNEHFSDAEGHRIAAIVSAGGGEPFGHVVAEIQSALDTARRHETGLYELRAATTGVELAAAAEETEVADDLRAAVESALERVDTTVDYPDLMAARAVL